MVPADCQLEATQQHARTVSVPACGVSTPMINNCTSVNSDSRHHQLISDQEPPDGDETDPDVIPNQYGKFIILLLLLLVIVPLFVPFSLFEYCKHYLFEWSKAENVKIEE